MFKKMILVLNILCCSYGAMAQTKNEPIEKYILNSEKLLVNGRPMQITDFKGKPLILELFTPSCVVCFKMLPVVNDLELQFRGKIQFLLVGSDEVTLPKTFLKFKQKLPLSLAAIFDSTIFNRFQPDFAPKYVWIDKNGIIRGMSSIIKIKSEFLSQFLMEDFSFLESENEKSYYRNIAPLVPTPKDLIFQSAISKAIDSLNPYAPAKLIISKSNPFFEAINVPVLHLYRYAYLGRSYWDETDSLYTSVVRTPQFEDDSDWNLFSRKVCYGISSDRLLSSSQLQDILRRDLMYNFGWIATLEPRSVPYWSVSVLNSKKNDLRSRFASTKRDFDFSGINYERIPIAELIKLLDHYCGSDMPFIDESGIDFPVDISINAMMTRLDDVRRALNKLGIVMERKYRFMDVMILRKIKTNVAANE